MRVTSTLADGYCSDEVDDVQLRRTMEVLSDQSGDEEEHQRRVDAFPFEASHTGGEYRYVGQTDDSVSHQRMDRHADVTQSGKYQNGCCIDDNYWRSARRDSRTTLTTSGLAGPMTMSSREVKSIQSTCCNVELGESVSMNNSDGLDLPAISVHYY